VTLIRSDDELSRRQNPQVYFPGHNNPKIKFIVVEIS
jgi:hypothetical protein